MLATREGHLPVIKYLVEAEVNIEAEDNVGDLIVDVK